ncbi:MAG: ATP-binding protein [Bacteroidia bacterium]|nr:ATP-binding protein [Bacteroidia bacterium]
MILKAEIKEAFTHQQQYLHTENEGYVRRLYLALMPKTATHIEVISGVRRCGKSTLLKLLMQRHAKSIAYFNFEDPRVYGFDVKDFVKLDSVMGTGHQAYYFDEIQNVPNWELFIRQLHDRGEKVYITGSNASLLSKELGTRLTGRHLRHELFPFSYPEFLTYTKQKDSDKNVLRYLQSGGFPEYLRDENPEVLQLLLKDIVLRDIAIRYGIKNTVALMDMTLFLLSNIGKPVTFNSLRKAFNIGSANSVSDYLHWLEDSYLLFLLPKFSWSAKAVAVNARKVYAIDNGLVASNTLSFSKDNGRMLENAVYMHLRQQPFQLSYFKEDKECDFVVAQKQKVKHVIQVCSEINSDTETRELAGLTAAMTFFKLKKGLIITTDQKDLLETKAGVVELIPLREFYQMKL